MSEARILTTHVGSLVRPPALVDFLVKQHNGEPYDQAAFETCLQECINAVVRRQIETGIDIVGDGEYGKQAGFFRYILERLAGFEQRPIGPDWRSPIAGKDRRDFAEFYEEYEATIRTTGAASRTRVKPVQWAISGPVSYRGQALIAADIARLRTALAGTDAQAFLPVIAPGSVAPDRQDDYYKNEEAALFALADALSEEYQAIINAGFIAQIDDPFVATWYDMMVPPASLADYRRWAELRIEALNHAIRHLPSERLRFHLCWGSWNGPHANDMSASDIIDLILKLNVGGISLEMANPRHEHEWRLWESVKLPEGKKLLPGVISHSTNIVEHPELVAERIVRLAKLVGRDNVIASTDCGFAQGPFTQRTHASIMWAKLAALVEGARLATAVLWPRRSAA